MKLTYFPIRGRAEPILLLLIDSGTEFEHEIIQYKTWGDLKARGENGPPNFPFAALPVLTFGHGARGGNDTKLAETGAILMFLEGKFAAAGTSPSPPDAKARLEMIRCASSFLLTRLFSLVSPTWLEPASRTHLLRSLIHPFLSSLSHHLSSSFFPPLLTRPLTNGQPGTSLSPAAATAYTTLCLIQELFPHSLGPGQGGGMMKYFPRCEQLRTSVEQRPRIKDWIESGKREVEWTTRRGGELKVIKKMADKYDRVEEVEELFGHGKKGRGERVGMEGVREEVELDTGV
ncbi:hypothetical protein MVLG_02870 [Microbotryum lychnidis-dioicae p1A1 Lamole]|uniref:GST N-terminal domain-containing protein n=2 Tax=Microbotryum TaxID=34416 RepID=U5H6H0_USTV1|nr:hypothetical protein MVLG_02870 [Microbotryum lychnidis-dioicae p1A1 Lamole]SGY25538.1 BQ5605_C018g08637 [Microbotryum silenes-dioicae]|eukprot:KDE06834.1 hypothetical protein MVLG_02870 [Microbotryum lychnidis-dioicae p1A1 Lamole]